MTDDQFFLANAYLDGELTAEERARAEADPEVMTEVEELRALQTIVRDVEPPSVTAREDAIAAAMAAFGPVAAATEPAAAPPAPAPIPYRSRPAYGKYLAIAAGVLGVGLLGVAIANSGVGGDDDAADEPASEEFDAAADEPADEPASDDRLLEQAVEPADEPAEEPAEAPVAESAAEPAAEEPASDEPASEDLGDDASDEPADAEIVSRPAVELGQVLSTPEQLGSYGNLLLDLRDLGELPPTPLHSCEPFAEALGRVTYADPLRPDAAPVELLLDVREAEGYVVAFDPETCDPVVDGPLYER